jgi:hypothetical protein
MRTSSRPAAACCHPPPGCETCGFVLTPMAEGYQEALTWVGLGQPRPKPSKGLLLQPISYRFPRIDVSTRQGVHQGIHQATCTRSRLRKHNTRATLGLHLTPLTLFENVSWLNSHSFCVNPLHSSIGLVTASYHHGLSPTRPEM